MGLIVLEISAVCDRSTYVGTLAVGATSLRLTFEVVAVRMNEPSLSDGNTLRELTFQETAIRIVHFPTPVRQVILNKCL